MGGLRFLPDWRTDIDDFMFPSSVRPEPSRWTLAWDECINPNHHPPRGNQSLGGGETVSYDPSPCTRLSLSRSSPACHLLSSRAAPPARTKPTQLMSPETSARFTMQPNIRWIAGHTNLRPPFSTRFKASLPIPPGPAARSRSTP